MSSSKALNRAEQLQLRRIFLGIDWLGEAAIKKTPFRVLFNLGTLVAFRSKLFYEHIYVGKNCSTLL